MLLNRFRKFTGAGRIMLSPEGVGYSVKVTGSEVEMVMASSGQKSKFDSSKVTVVGREILAPEDKEWAEHMDKELGRWVPCWVNNLCQARR